MGGRGSKSSQGGGGGLPESISSTMQNKSGEIKIDGNIIHFKNKSVTVYNIQELTDEKLMKQAKQIGMEDPVVAGGNIMERKFAQRAIEQKEQEKQNYATNMAKNVKGYDELQKEIGKEESEYRKYKKSIDAHNEYGDKVYAKQKTYVAELKEKYPRAASYIEAEGFSNASNYKKSSLGREAMEAIRMGKPHKKAIETMKKKWKEYTESRAFD